MSHLLRGTLGLGCALALSATLVVDARGASWLSGGWSHRIELTAKPELIAGEVPLEDFSILVEVDGDSASSVFIRAKPDGTDIVVTAGDGLTVLDHEIVTFDSSGQTAELWFKANALSTSENVFYLYFGNPDTTVAPVPGAAWSADHHAVYHFSEDPSLGVLVDHGPRGKSANTGPQSTFTPDDLVAAHVGMGWNYDGTTDWTYAEGLSVPDSSFTISSWFANVRMRDEGMLALQALSGFWRISFLRSGGSPYASIAALGNMWWEPSLLDPEPHHYVWTLDARSDTARFFLDGVEQEYVGRYVPPGASEVYTGQAIQGRVGVAGPVYYNALDLTNGVVDEYRIVEGIRSPDWILTEYHNQSNPAAFFMMTEQQKSIGTAVESHAPPTVGRISVWPNPCQGRAQIDVDLGGPVRNVAVYDIAGRLVRTLPVPGLSEGVARAFWDGRDDAGRNVGSGVYFVRAAGDQAVSRAKVLLMR